MPHPYLNYKTIFEIKVSELLDQLIKDGQGIVQTWTIFLANCAFFIKKKIISLFPHIHARLID